MLNQITTNAPRVQSHERLTPWRYDTAPFGIDPRTLAGEFEFERYVEERGFIIEDVLQCRPVEGEEPLTDSERRQMIDDDLARLDSQNPVGAQLFSEWLEAANDIGREDDLESLRVTDRRVGAAISKIIDRHDREWARTGERGWIERCVLGSAHAPKIDFDAAMSEVAFNRSDPAYQDPKIIKALEAMNSRYALVTVGSEMKVAFAPDDLGIMPDFKTKSWLADLYRNQVVLVPNGRAKGDGDKYKEVSPAHLWMHWKDRRTFENGVVFEPTGSKKSTRGYYNIFRGLPVAGRKGDWSLLHGHIRENVCQGDDLHYRWLMTWIAQLYQQPGRKMGSCVVVRGKKGVGKSKLFDWIGKSLGPYALTASQKRHIVGNFNGHQKGALFMQCEEAFWAGDHQAGSALKHLITSETMLMEMKGIDPVTTSNYCRLAFISNESWVVPAGDEDERRYFVLECGDNRLQDIDFFIAVDAQMESGGMEAMIYDFQRWDPVKDGGFAEGFEALRKPPHTSAMKAQSAHTREIWDRFFVRLLIDGGCASIDHPFVPALHLEGDDAMRDDAGNVFVPVAHLRSHFEAFLASAGPGARAKIGNDEFLLELARRWLCFDGRAQFKWIDGRSARAYLIPPLAAIREHHAGVVDFTALGVDDAGNRPKTIEDLRAYAETQLAGARERLREVEGFADAVAAATRSGDEIRLAALLAEVREK